MNKYFRYLLLTKLQKKAAVFDSVKMSLEQKGFKAEDVNKPIYSGKIKINSGNPNVTITVPDNPIIGGIKKSDGTYENGKYNVFIQIKSGFGATKAGINAIIVEANANIDGGLSGAYDKLFPNADWAKTALSNIQSTMTKYFGNVSLNKLGVGNFSAGYSGADKLLKDPVLKNNITDVVSLDGMHYGKSGKINEAAMKPWLDFAKAAKNDPNKKFIMLHTSVNPGSYISTTETSQYLLDQLGMKRQSNNNEIAFAGVKPASIANDGGVSIIQLYDKQDPYTINNKPNVFGTSGYQHIQAAKSLPDVWNKALQYWNNG